MIYGLTFSWKKSYCFAKLCHVGLNKNNIKHIAFFDDGDDIPVDIINLFNKNSVCIKYKNKQFKGGHRGWPDVMVKINEYRKLNELFNFQDNDWIIDMDDDTFMCNDKLVSLLTSEKSLVGIEHEPKYQTKLGMFGHMSGAFIAMKGFYFKKMINHTDEELATIQQEHFKKFKLCEMWDLVISYLMCYVGAECFNITKKIICDANAEDYFTNKCDADFFHFNYQPKIFLGVSCPNGRYDIPSILKNKGIIKYE